MEAVCVLQSGFGMNSRHKYLAGKLAQLRSDRCVEDGGARVRNGAGTSNTRLLLNVHLLWAESAAMKQRADVVLACERWANPIALLRVIPASKTRVNKLL